MERTLRADARGPVTVPLVVWAYALAFSLLLFWQLHDYLVGDTPRSEAFHLHNAARLERLAQAVEDGALGVVLLGDSRLRYATPQDESISALLSESLGRAVSAVRIAHDWAVYDDFAGLAPLILEARPALVVLQEELFAKERETPGRLLLGREYLLWRITGRGPWNPGGKDQELYQREQRCEVLADVDAEVRKEKVFLWVRFDPSGANAEAIAAFQRQAEAQGTAIAVLTIPVTADARAVIPGYDHPDDARTLAMKGGVPDQDFCDPVHMDPEGRAAFTAWLIPNLAARLEGARR